MRRSREGGRAAPSRAAKLRVVVVNPMILHYFTLFYSILLDYIRFYTILNNFTWFNTNLQDFTWFYTILQDFMIFKKILLDYTLFYAILHNFTRFYIYIYKKTKQNDLNFQSPYRWTTFWNQCIDLCSKNYTKYTIYTVNF